MRKNIKHGNEHLDECVGGEEKTILPLGILPIGIRIFGAGTKCQLDKMSTGQNVNSTKSGQNVNWTKCQLDKMSTQQKVDKMSTQPKVDKMSTQPKLDKMSTQNNEFLKKITNS